MIEPPLEAVSPGVAAVTMAVTLGARSIRQVATMAGMTDIGFTHQSLREARDLGLVAFEDNYKGTLRPTLGIAAASPR